MVRFRGACALTLGLTLLGPTDLVQAQLLSNAFQGALLATSRQPVELPELGAERKAESVVGFSPAVTGQS